MHSSPLLPIIALRRLLELESYNRSHPEMVDGRARRALSPWPWEVSVSPRLLPPGFLNERGKYISSRLLGAALSA